MRFLGRDDLLTHPDYQTREDRKRNRHALRRELESTLTTRPAADWERDLNARGIPTGPVLTVPEALSDPQIAKRGLIAGLSVENEVVKVAASPVMINGKRPHPKTPPPKLGADNDSVWTELGMTPNEIANLREEGVI